MFTPAKWRPESRTWVIFNVTMLVVVIATAAAAQSAGNSCKRVSSEAQTYCGSGASLLFGAAVLVWIIGFVVLSVICVRSAPKQ